MNRCEACFKPIDAQTDMCPYCGYVHGELQSQVFALPIGTVLGGRYKIGSMLGFGGFGITYRAWDMKMESVVCVKEYFQGAIVNRAPGTQNVILVVKNRKKELNHGMVRFLDEARSMARFNGVANIVNVFEFFEENNTAYIVMELLEGEGLNSYLKKKGGVLSADEATKIILDTCKALKIIHKGGIIHRDISPDNIFMCKNGIIKLMDFGAARISLYDKERTIVLKPGYAPPEQYNKLGAQGPWTDIYALAATYYVMLTGIKPQESTNRQELDELEQPQVYCPELPDHVNNTIMRAMALEHDLRIPTVDAFEKGICREKKVLSVEQEKKRRKMTGYAGIVGGIIIAAALCGVLLGLWKIGSHLNTIPDGEITVWIVDTQTDDWNAGATATDGETVITKTTGYSGVVAAFMKEYPGIKINLVTFTSVREYALKLAEAYNDNEMPDVFMTDGINIDLLDNLVKLSEIYDSDIVARSSYLSKKKWFGEDMLYLPLGFRYNEKTDTAYVSDCFGISYNSDGNVRIAKRLLERMLYSDYQLAIFSAYDDFSIIPMNDDARETLLDEVYTSYSVIDDWDDLDFDLE